MTNQVLQTDLRKKKLNIRSRQTIKCLVRSYSAYRHIHTGSLIEYVCSFHGEFHSEEKKTFLPLVYQKVHIKS